MPDDIPAAKLDTGFDQLSCRDARIQLETERSSLAALSAEQTKIANTDKITSAVLFVPVSVLSGQDRETDVATAKGRIDALETRLGRCT